MQLAIDTATFEGRDLAEFFPLEYCPMRTYFTVQMTRQKKWAEDKSAHLFHASCIPVDLPLSAQRIGI